LKARLERRDRTPVSSAALVAEAPRRRAVDAHVARFAAATTEERRLDVGGTTRPSENSRMALRREGLEDTDEGGRRGCGEALLVALERVEGLYIRLSRS